jgi:nucleotide-binding universal stress UspA family protein
VPHDGSEMSDQALKHALYLAKLSGAQLVILHVIESEAIPPSALLTFIRPEVGLKGAKELPSRSSTYTLLQKHLNHDTNGKHFTRMF